MFLLIKNRLGKLIEKEFYPRSKNYQSKRPQFIKITLILITSYVKRFLFSHGTTLLCEQKHFIFYVIRHTVIAKCKHNVCRKHIHTIVYDFLWNNDLQLGMLTYQIK